jgi:hypothetical protein
MGGERPFSKSHFDAFKYLESIIIAWLAQLNCSIFFTLVFFPSKIEMQKLEHKFELMLFLSFSTMVGKFEGYLSVCDSFQTISCFLYSHFKE